MYKQKRVCVVVPAFNEEEQIRGVIETMPDFVDHIIVVDDGSSDETSRVAKSVADSRVEVIRHERNQGVGGAIVTGHRQCLLRGVDLSVVMAGDGQMDPAHLSDLLDAIVVDGYDFAKGNRFLSRATLKGMPRHRIIGNAFLTFLTKFASGYWHVFDPQNGYTAITRNALETVSLDEVRRGYLFENSLLCELNRHDLRVKDVPMPAVYRGQDSGIRPARFGLSAAGFLFLAFWGRIFRRYLYWDFHPIALFYLLGTVLTLWGICFGSLIVIWSLGPASATAGTIMLSVVPFVAGLQLLLTAITMDVSLSSK